MTETHQFRPYANIPELCVAELHNGETCNQPKENHATAPRRADMDTQYRKYYAARLWIVEARKTSLDPHQFAKRYAESDWDQPADAWNEMPS